MAAAGTIPPPVSWAQRSEFLYVIIDVECKDIEHKVTEDSFYFKGVNALETDKKYEVTLNFLHPVDPERVTCKNIGRCLEFTIYKKTPGAYWPSLTNSKTKLHFLKANFTKWNNESDEEDNDLAPNDPFNLMNAGMNWNNKFDDFNVGDDEEEDSDDNIPSLSQNDEDDEQQPENTSAAGGDKPESAADDKQK